jgi:hypothetical protein
MMSRGSRSSHPNNAARITCRGSTDGVYDKASGRRFRTPRPRARCTWPNCTIECRMTDEDLKAELERLRAENERLKNRSGRGVSLKVSEKGGVSVYGLGRFPVTLYKEQWARLLDMADDIRSFIKENDGKLKAKAD